MGIVAPVDKYILGSSPTAEVFVYSILQHQQKIKRRNAANK